jgi:hypothetical protein
MKVVNLSTIAQQVAVNLPDGRKTSVRIMPRSRIDLAQGQVVCPNWIALNPRVLKIFDNPPPAKQNPAPVPEAAPANPEVAVQVKDADAGKQGE